MTTLVIGLGHMGLPIARRLVASGERVIGVDISPERCDLFRQSGGDARDAVDDEAHDADVAVTVLADIGHIRDVYLGKRGLIAAMKRGAILIDCSTIDVATARVLQGAAVEAGHFMLDAPVSGGVAAAEAGTLSIMVGGDAEAFSRAEPVLRRFGRTIVHAGGPGAGLAAKLCNNLVVGATIGVLSEAFALGERLGLSSKVLFDVMSASTAQSWALQHVCPAPDLVPTAPSSNGYRPGGKTSIILKDMSLAAEAARDASIDSPIGAAALSLYERFAEAGGGDADCTGVFALLSRRWPQQS